jgi:hypothetical protein
MEQNGVHEMSSNVEKMMLKVGDVVIANGGPELVTVVDVLPENEYKERYVIEYDGRRRSVFMWSDEELCDAQHDTCNRRFQCFTEAV